MLLDLEKQEQQEGKDQEVGTAEGKVAVCLSLPSIIWYIQVHWAIKEATVSVECNGTRHTYKFKIPVVKVLQNQSCDCLVSILKFMKNVGITCCQLL